MKFLLAGASLLLLFASPVIAQENTNSDTTGLTCNKILAMKKDAWAEYYYKKTGNSSLAATDRASIVYAQCHKKRNDKAMAALPVDLKQSISIYRQLYQQYRVASIDLESAYAGGGTAHGHQLSRTSPLDEEMVEALIRLKRQSKPTNNVKNKEVQVRIDRLRSQVRQLNPAIPKNQEAIPSPSYRNHAVSSYAEMKQSVDSIIPMLLKEREDVSLVILKFMDRLKN
ncbi:hypothetical protein GTQ43_03580 [Nostoc sp. KVJ3]|uniref:hypothetical protein n=1 Tax=Nostoc sp. KVJ3 TaxID=457945 RepID=UPI00223746D7|nr:hypothetical protein [Nostoc sp. KVJ3]MCW5312962.1 hypothetical protein [Nostoc sp. KVJ3]